MVECWGGLQNTCLLLLILCWCSSTQLLQDPSFFWLHHGIPMGVESPLLLCVVTMVTKEMRRKHFLFNLWVLLLEISWKSLEDPQTKTSGWKTEQILIKMEWQEFSYSSLIDGCNKLRNIHIPQKSDGVEMPWINLKNITSNNVRIIEILFSLGLHECESLMHSHIQIKKATWK